jgi:hypothetical protein
VLHEHHLHYILGVKEGDHASLFAQQFPEPSKTQ